MMNQLTPPVCSTGEKPTGPDAGQKPRPVRVAALLNALPIFSALVLGVAMAAPKIPPFLGE
jgi:hypothetical protein